MRKLLPILTHTISSFALFFLLVLTAVTPPSGEPQDGMRIEVVR